MIQTETNLVVADNSGARSVRVFRLKGGSTRKSCSIGDIAALVSASALSYSPTLCHQAGICSVR